MTQKAVYNAALHPQFPLIIYTKLSSKWYFLPQSIAYLNIRNRTMNQFPYYSPSVSLNLSHSTVIEMDGDPYVPPENSDAYGQPSNPPLILAENNPPPEERIQLEASVPSVRPSYDPFLVPWNIEIAKGHSVILTQTAKKVANFQKKLEEDDEDEANYCPCCGNPLFAERFPLWCSITNLSELGEGIPLYYDLIKWVLIGFLGAFFISSIYCLHENYGEKRISEWSESLDSNMILEGSLANFGRNSEPSLTQPWLHVGCMWLFFIIHQYCLHRHKRMCASMDRGVITPSDYTCVVTKLPGDIQLEELVGEIEQRTGSKVSHVNFASDIREFSKVQKALNGLKVKKTKLDRARETTGSQPRTKRCLICSKSEVSIETLEQEIRAKEEILAQLERKFTGIAFVTFQQDESKCYSVAKTFAKQFGKVKATGFKAVLKLFFSWCIKETVAEKNMLKGTAFKVQRAPEPDDIIWENLGVRGR